MTNEWHKLSDEELAALTDSGRAWYERVRKTHAVNLRVLNGFDLDAIKGKIIRADTKTEGYENP
jgi:hypothetical protein